MPDSDHAAQFRDYAAHHQERLRRFAYLLCGDWQRAEDAVQAALTKLYLAWPRISRHPVDAYARRVVVTSVADVTRRAWFRRERSAERLPDRPAPTPDADDRLLVMDALARLPRRQRAVVVLRFWEDRSVQDTARILKCSMGTVKSHTARGLATLRELLGETVSVRHEEVTR